MGIIKLKPDLARERDDRLAEGEQLRVDPLGRTVPEVQTRDRLPVAGFSSPRRSGRRCLRARADGVSVASWTSARCERWRALGLGGAVDRVAAGPGGREQCQWSRRLLIAIPLRTKLGVSPIPPLLRGVHSRGEPRCWPSAANHLCRLPSRSCHAERSDMGTMFMALVLFGSSALGVAISLALVAKYALDREPGSGE